MKVLGFGTYDVASHPRVGIILDGLADHGHTIRAVNAPLGIGTSGRIEALSGIRAGLTFVTTLMQRWCTLVSESRPYRGSSGHAPDVVVVGYLGHFDVLVARILFPRTTIVLDHLIFASDTANDRGLGRNPIVRLALRALDGLALRCASLIAVDTQQHLTMVPERLRSRAVVVPVGAPDEWFAAGQTKRDSGLGSVVFFGLFTPLQGVPTLAAALRILHDRGTLPLVTLIGRGQDDVEVRQILEGVPVTWLDWVPSDELPQTVAAHDICMGIMGTTDKARRVVPNKVYQGLAARCAVITSDTHPQRDMLADTVVFVQAGDPVALAHSIEALSRDQNARTAIAERGFARARELFTRRAVVHDLLRKLGA